MESKKNGFGSYLPLTFLIGFGFFTMGLMDPLYDSYVQIFLAKYIPLKSVIGVIMSIDNILALFLIPVISVWSDRTRTPLGRRMPWIVILLPLSALCFAGIPYAAESSLAALIALLLVLNVFKQSARGPVVALMPDIIPGEYRSQANGVINTMGNIAAIIGTIFLARLMDVDATLPLIGATKNRLAFPVASLFVIFAVILLVSFVREKPAAAEGDSEKSVPFRQSFRTIFEAKDKSAFLVLFSLFLWFVGYQGVVPYLTEFSITTFGLTTGQGPLGMGMVGIFAAIAAIPMGYAASRWGRRRMIRISLVAIVILILGVFFIEPLIDAGFIPAASAKFVFWGLMACFGIFWVCVVANSFPMLWQMAHYGNIGMYTGLYYTFSQLAAIVAPALFGFVIDAFGMRSMFVLCAVFYALAFSTMGFVTGGEKDDKPAEMVA
jgi:MFS-type transporter involved in bile tolerance (Atg22 family)